MLASGNYVQWKSRIKRYIDTKHNNELIRYCLQNPPYKFKWTEKTVLIILIGIDNDIYSTVNACPNACEMWKAIERLKQGESINVQDIETNLYWEFGKFTSRDGESLESYYSRFVTLVKQSQELNIVSYHKLYDILKQHQNKVNEIRAKRLARIANLLVLVAQQQPAYHPQNHTTHYPNHSSTISQPAVTRNRGKAFVNSSTQTYDQAHATVADDDEMSKEKEIDKPIALISLSFKKIYKPTNNNLRTTSNTRTQQNFGIQCFKYKEYKQVSKECQKLKQEKDVAYHKEKMLLCKQEEVGVQLNIQEVTLDAADIFGPIFDVEPLQKVHNDDGNYNVFDNDQEHPEQPESVNEPYLAEQDEHNIIIDSLDMYLKKFQAELDRYHDVNYASKVAINDAKAKRDLIKEAQIKFYKSREDKEIDKVIALENKVNILDDIVYKIGQSVQIMNMLNRNCKTSFAKPEFLKKAQRENPCLYDIGCYNDDNLALMLAPESDETIRPAKESRSKLSDLIRPFDYDQLNNVYDLFVPQREKS
ncbi:hypothetical protein Tco_1323885, partial [Tanacetum coccineum]